MSGPTAGRYRFFVRDTNGVGDNISSAVADNGVWQHVAAVFNATNGLMNLYVNGALAGSAAAPSSLLATNHEVAFGNRQSSMVGYDCLFTGALDDVRIYSRDLTLPMCSRSTRRRRSRLLSPSIRSLTPISIPCMPAPVPP